MPKNNLHTNAKHADILGEIGWWTLSKETAVQHDRLIALFEQHGFDAGLIPQPVSPKRAWRRALSDARKEYAGEALIPNVQYDPDDVPWTTVQAEEVDLSNHEHNFAQSATLYFHYQPAQKRQDIEEGGTITTDGVLLADTWVAGVVDYIRKQYSYHCNTLSMDDVRCAIKNVLDQGLAVRVRIDGGVYFVPYHNITIVSALRDILGHLNCRWTSFPIPVGQAQEVIPNFEEAFEAEVNNFEVSLGHTFYDEGGKPRSGLRYKTAVRKMDEVNALYDKMEAYENLLQFKAQGARKRLEALKNEITPVVASAMESASE